LTLDATGRLELRGQTFSLNANATGEVRTSGILTVQGSVVRIN
jgi:hypothetical protein